MSPSDDHPTDAGALPALAPGTVVGGRFQIVAQLGTGGMGRVYRAFDRSLDQVVALKMLHADLEPDPKLIASFRHEVKLARLITHPAVCRLHDLEEADGHHFLTMELIEGETLAERLARTPRLPAAELTRIARGIAAGLGAAHAVGVLHLDLKPGNVMLEQGGRVVVMDFGLARVLQPAGEVPGRGAVAGTVAYMAPEQLAGGPLDPRVDVYSLGLVLYEMACGRVPGVGTTAAATAQVRLEGEAPDPRTERPDLPERLRRTIQRCLVPRPADRFATVDEVWRALDAASGGRWRGDVTGRFTVAPPPDPRRTRRRALVVAVALLLVAGAVAFALQRRPRVREVPRIAVLVDERQATGDPASARLRRAAQRLVARELLERGLAAAPEPRPGAGLASARVRLTRAGEAFTVEVELAHGRLHVSRSGRGRALADAARQAAEALAAAVRTPAPPPDPRALAAVGTTSMEALREITLARAAVHQQDRARVELHATRALQADPNLVAAHLALASAEEAFTDQSRAHLRRARDAARGRTDVTSQLARARARYEADGDDVGGNAELAALYAANPGAPEIAYPYAESLGDLWQVEKANAILERMLEANPAHVPAMLRLFDLRLSNNEIAQLLRDGNRIIEQTPEQPQAYVVLGRSLLAAGRLDEALRVLGEALVIAPDHAAALTFTGRTLLYVGKLAEARAVASRLLAGDARSKAAGLRTLGLTFLLEGRFTDGLRSLEDSLRACPEEATEPVWTYRVIVYALEDSGDLEGAKAAARRWEEHSLKSSFWSQVAYARQEQDLCRLRLGQLTPAEVRAQLPRYLADLKAKAGADVVAGQGPKLAMWHASALGERREALAAALKDEVPAVYTQFLIAESYAGLGQHEKAVEWYRRILTKPDEEMVPTIFVRTRFRLAEALDALGRADEARAAYASFLAAWGNANRPLASVAKARARLAALPEKAAAP